MVNRSLPGKDNPGNSAKDNSKLPVPANPQLPDNPDESRGEVVARNLGLMREQAEAYYRRGLQNFDRNDYENAILDLSESIYYDRRHAEYYSVRGFFYAVDNQVDNARLDLEYAISLNKRQWLAYYALGMLEYQDRNFSAALIQFDLAHRYSIHRPEIFYYRGVTHFQLGDDKKAIEDMHRAIQLFKTDDKRRKDAQAWLKEFQNSEKANDPNRGDLVKKEPGKPSLPDRPQPPGSSLTRK